MAPPSEPSMEKVLTFSWICWDYFKDQDGMPVFTIEHSVGSGGSNDRQFSCLVSFKILL